jgi:hypothetical protein
MKVNKIQKERVYKKYESSSLMLISVPVFLIHCSCQQFHQRALGIFFFEADNSIVVFRSVVVANGSIRGR